MPVIGYADDAIFATDVLRSVVRRAGLEPVRAHWPGTDHGFTVLTRLTGLANLATETAAPQPDTDWQGTDIDSHDPPR